MSHATPVQDNAPEVFDREIGLTPPEQELILEFFPSPPARILDLGCGNGRTTVPLHRLGYEMVGLDLYAPLVQIAAGRWPDIRFVVGDACRLEFPDDSFDGVLFSWNGLDCIPSIRGRCQALREIHRVLRPRGRFLFSSHNALGCWGRLIKPMGLTRIALRFLCDQFPLRRSLLDWYCFWRDSNTGNGCQAYFSAPPRVNRNLLAKMGWSVLAVRGDMKPGLPARTMFDVHVHYVCEKRLGNLCTKCP